MDQEIAISFEKIISQELKELNDIPSLYPHFRKILWYLQQKRDIPNIQELISIHEDQLIESTIHAAQVYCSFLQSVIPTNVTYFHFLRESQLYRHYVVIEYILYTGYSGNLNDLAWESFFSRMQAHSLALHTFQFVVPWLATLVEYKCSAIDIECYSADRLVEVLYLLACGLLGRSNQSIFQHMDSIQRHYLFKRFMAVNVYVLIKSAKQPNMPLVAMVVSCLRKMLIENNAPQIIAYIPSYLYIDFIDSVKCPRQHEVIVQILMKLLLENALNQNKAAKEEMSPLTVLNIWGLINLITSKYGTYNHQLMVQFMKLMLAEIKAESPVRALALEAIETLRLQEKDRVLLKYYSQNQFKYRVQDKIVSTKVLVNNFRAFMTIIYSKYVEEAAKKKQIHLSQHSIWKNILKFNITDLEDAYALR